MMLYVRYECCRALEYLYMFRTAPPVLRMGYEFESAGSWASPWSRMWLLMAMFVNAKVCNSGALATGTPRRMFHIVCFEVGELAF